MKFWDSATFCSIIIKISFSVILTQVAVKNTYFQGWELYADSCKYAGLPLNLCLLQILSIKLSHGNRNCKFLTLWDADFGPVGTRISILQVRETTPPLSVAFTRIRENMRIYSPTVLIPDLEKLCKNSPSESIIYKVYCCLRFYRWQILSLYTFIYFNFFYVSAILPPF